jgi:hypothetical protein
MHTQTHPPRQASANTWLLAFCACLLMSEAARAEGLICEDPAPPPGATQVGATVTAFRDCPRLDEVDFTGRAAGRKYHAGLYFTPVKDRALYRQAEDGLVMQRGGAVATVRMDSRPGQFPLLSGARPFYIEAQVTTSSNHRDNFPAVWLMPIEHNLRMEDVYPPDPKSFERWFELDIDEGGFGPGSHHTAISWTGIYPNYQKIQNPNPTSQVPLDRTQPNVFGVSYSPDDLTVRWWVNGRQVLEAAHPYVPEIARRQNFYLIVSAQSHKNISQYEMKLMGVRAFVGEPKGRP